MTDRGLPIVDGAPACPFVAFEDDRDGRGQAPDHRHRCYAEPRPAPRALAHQEAYCLSSAFPVCPTFQDWARREAATARAAQAEIDAAAMEEPPVSQALPPRERDPYHASDTDTPPPLPPRRNPPRDWAAPPPWAGDTDGEPPEAPSFLAASSQAAAAPVPSADRTGASSAYGAESRGLAGSAADRLAGPDVDDGGDGRRQADPGWPVDDGDDPDARYRPPAAGIAAAGAVAGVAATRCRVAAVFVRAPAGIRSVPSHDAAHGRARRLESPAGGRTGAVVERAQAGGRPQDAGAVRALRARLGAPAPVRGVPHARGTRRSAVGRRHPAHRRRGDRRPPRGARAVLHRSDAAGHR